jgi:endonuclease/exonuclease/phosphatase family metal-dependent hydrolase
MKIAAWNLNNRVGRVPFRADAADAAIALDADVYVFNEYYPQSNEIAFRRTLADAGWQHQALSPDTGEKANRVLIVSRTKLAPLPLKLPDFDRQFPANLLGVHLPDFGVSVLGLRLPWYESTSLVIRAWDWVEEAAATFISEPSIIVGDLNAGLNSKASRGGDHLRRIIDSGWQRASPPTGFSYFGSGGKRSEIDHLLSTSHCRISNPHYVTQQGQHCFAGTAGSISDHAALVAIVGASIDR